MALALFPWEIKRSEGGGRENFLPRVVVETYNPRTQFKDSLAYTVKPCLKKKNEMRS